jgi:acyl-CoA dehydrogenase
MYTHNEQTTTLIDLVRRLSKEHQWPLETRLLRGENIVRADKQPGVLAARELGLWSLNCPPELGGPGLSLVDRLAITEENFRGLVPIAFGGNALPPTFVLKGEQKRRYLDPFLAGEQSLCMAQTEPQGGADPAGAIHTMARQTDQGWSLTGAKIWISGFDDADTVFVLARTDKDKGASGISMFAVPKGNAGLIARPVAMLGGFQTHQLTFDDCRVDALAMIGLEGAGFKGAQQALTAARFDVGARALGIAQRAYEMMVEHAKQRSAFGGPLAEKQAVQSMIVDSWIEIQQNRLTMLTCAEKVDRGQDGRVEAGMVKMLCTEMVDRVIDRAIQIYGAAGCTYESPLAHWYDHQRMARIYEGPTEVHKYRVLARHLLS